jgi:MoaA/NifB/PqqE/SkfB family radical SAM enzyme
MGSIPLGIARPQLPEGRQVLWALRSHCDLACRYCYFADAPLESGNSMGLSHSSSDDLRKSRAMDVAESILVASRSRRVFVAGGEPLAWRPVTEVVDVLISGGVDVVLCTNGINLINTALVTKLLKSGVGSFSVSLDSVDPVVNDAWRPDRHGDGTWDRVNAGLQNLLRLRDDLESSAKVGVYSVMTAVSLDSMTETAQFVADLGCDYYMAQPVSLPTWHRHHSQLTLGDRHIDAWLEACRRIRSRGEVAFPDGEYDDRVADAIANGGPHRLTGCGFGGDPFFMMPNGEIRWCPSSHRVSPNLDPRGIEVGPGSPRSEFSCDYFSDDCVNMLALSTFERWALGNDLGSGR